VHQAINRNITIIGGGLAGLTLGIGLRQQGVGVSLHEAGNLPRHRVCGEFICGKGAAILSGLGLKSLLADAVLHDKVHWYHKEKKLFQQKLPTPAIGISRYVLDQRLADFFTCTGGQLHCNQRVSLKNELIPGEGNVFCNGRQRATGKPLWLGMKLHLQSTPHAHTNGLSVYLGDGCYVGLSAIENGQLNLCGLFRLRPGIGGGKLQSLLHYLDACGLHCLLRVLEEGEPDESSFCAVTALDFSPLSHFRSRLTLGDQMGMIAPFTGNGMSIALESASMAIAPLVDYAYQQCGWSEATLIIQQHFSQHFSMRMNIARWLHPLLLNSRSQAALGYLGRWHLLPLNHLFKLTH
jgi:flavin-dependent dehydrogenase